jgi:2-oxoisovalerate dehydrogenase E2 component (dihydrolipoyl transacylase)
MSEFVFKLPDLGEGLVEAEIAEWMVKVGDLVQEEDAIGAMLTDKAAVELSAPVSGRVLSLAGDIGDTIAVGSPLIVFEIQEGQAPVEQAPTPSVMEQDKQETVSKAAAEDAPKPAQPTKVLTSPSIRQQAREAGIDLARVAGSGPRGRILKSDLDAFLADGSSTAASLKTAKKPATGVTAIKVVGLRRIIADRMSAANREIPHFAYVEEIDVTALESLRQHLNNKKTPADLSASHWFVPWHNFRSATPCMTMNETSSTSITPSILVSLHRLRMA